MIKRTEQRGTGLGQPPHDARLLDGTNARNEPRCRAATCRQGLPAAEGAGAFAATRRPPILTSSLDSWGHHSHARTVRSKGVQIPFAEIGPSDGEYIRATGYGNLAKGLYLCQHSADLAARVELSKLARVQVTEKSVDRIRERTGKDAEQDIEVVREGLVNEVLSDVRIVDRKVDKEAGTCSSTAVIPKRNLFPTPASPDAGISGPQ